MNKQTRFTTFIKCHSFIIDDIIDTKLWKSFIIVCTNQQ